MSKTFKYNSTKFNLVTVYQFGVRAKQPQRKKERKEEKVRYKVK